MVLSSEWLSLLQSSAFSNVGKQKAPSINFTLYDILWNYLLSEETVLYSCRRRL